MGQVHMTSASVLRGMRELTFFTEGSDIVWICYEQEGEEGQKSRGQFHKICVQGIHHKNMWSGTQIHYRKLGESEFLITHLRVFSKHGFYGIGRRAFS